MRRNKSFNEEISQRLRKPSYAKQFMIGLMDGEDGLSLEDAVRKTIEVMGVKEFSEFTGYPAPNLVAFIKGRRILKPETLDMLLKPFKLRTKIVLDQAS